MKAAILKAEICMTFKPNYSRTSVYCFLRVGIITTEFLLSPDYFPH